MLQTPSTYVLKTPSKRLEDQQMFVELFVNGKEIFICKADNKNFNFPTQFCLGNISNGFSATESREASLNGNVYDFSVDYTAIDKSGT